MSYWDTSCLLKLYIEERESALLRARVASGDVIITSVIARYEMRAALAQKEALGDLPAGGALRAFADFESSVREGNVSLIDLDGRVADSFERVIESSLRANPAIRIRTLDALHVASAIASRQSTVVTTDLRMRELVREMGLLDEPKTGS